MQEVGRLDCGLSAGAGALSATVCAVEAGGRRYGVAAIAICDGPDAGGTGAAANGVPATATAALVGLGQVDGGRDSKSPGGGDDGASGLAGAALYWGCPEAKVGFCLLSGLPL